MEDRQDDRLPAIVEYLRMHPTSMLPGAESSGSQGAAQVIHIHEHHHYAPPPPPPPPPKPTVADQLLPWLWFALMACIIATICAAILAVVIVALVLGLLALAVVVALVAYLVKQMNEGRALNTLASKMPAQPQGRRKK